MSEGVLPNESKYDNGREHCLQRRPNTIRTITASRANQVADKPAPKADNTAAQSDSVSLGESRQAASTPPAPVPEKKEDKGPITLKPSELSRPLSHPKAREIHKSLNPEMSLSKLSEALFQNDPAAEHNSTFELKFHEDEEWKSLVLVSTRPSLTVR